MQKIASMHHQIIWCFENYNRILDASEEDMFRGYDDLEKEAKL